MMVRQQAGACPGFRVERCCMHDPHPALSELWLLMRIGPGIDAAISQVHDNDHHKERENSPGDEHEEKTHEQSKQSQTKDEQPDPFVA